MISSTKWHVQLERKDSDEVTKINREFIENGVVYKVYFKKKYFQEDENQEEKSCSLANLFSQPDKPYHKWRLEEIKTVKYAKKERLIQMLSSLESHSDKSFLSIFLCTFRSFISPESLVDKILKLYYNYWTNNSLESHVRHSHTKYVISSWILKFKRDFFEPPDHLLVHKLIVFFSSKCPNSKLENKLISFLNYLKHKKQEKNWFRRENIFERFAVNAFYDLDFLSPAEYAQQLTCLDADLFLDVYIPQCLGSTWSRRNENKSLATSVKATIDHFNNIISRISGAILSRDIKTHSTRAQVIERWIAIAQELRNLKNFSGLKAVLSSLQSASIFRLKTSWLQVNIKYQSIYESLTTTLSDDNNHTNYRLLLQEGSSKFATSKSHRRVKSCVSNLINLHDESLNNSIYEKTSISQGNYGDGIVPFLGTFLTDLTMLHSASKDIVYVEDIGEVINFEKKRKEHEVLSQLYVMQTSCRGYKLSKHPEFLHVFQKLPTLLEHECFKISCSIEPPERSMSQKISSYYPQYRTVNKPFNASKPSLPLRNLRTSNKYSSSSFLSSLSSSSSSTLFSLNSSQISSSSSSCIYSFSSCWNFNSLQHKLPPKQELKHFSSSLSKKEDFKSRPLYNTSLPQVTIGNKSSGIFANVSLEGVAGVYMTAKFKTIYINKDNTTEEVIRKGLEEFGVPESPLDFYLFQTLPGHPGYLVEGDQKVINSLIPSHSYDFSIKKKAFKIITIDHF